MLFEPLESSLSGETYLQLSQEQRAKWRQGEKKKGSKKGLKGGCEEMLREGGVTKASTKWCYKAKARLIRERMNRRETVLCHWTLKVFDLIAFVSTGDCRAILPPSLSAQMFGD